MDKAYDGVDWNFLIEVLRKFGFVEDWVAKIKKCIT